MRIAFISHISLNLQRFRAPVIRLLAERGHTPLVFVPDEEHDAELAAMGARVIHYPLVRGSMNPLHLAAPMRELRRLIQEHEPDVVHSFTHQPNILTRFAAGGIKGARPAVVNSVTGLGSCFLGTGFKGMIVRSMFEAIYRSTSPNCDVLLFQNTDDESYFTDRGIQGASAIHLIRGSGVDIDRFSPDALSPTEREAERKKLGIEPDDVVFTLTARLIADKGVREFLDAAGWVSQELAQAKFLLVGEPDPGNPASLSPEEVARITADPSVIMAGWRDDMETVWAMSDVAVLPSYREGLPVSLQEALAAGLPVVTTDVPGCREIGGGEHCVLVPARQSQGLGEAMLAFGRDVKRREAAGSAARVKAEKEFDGRVIAGMYLELYEKLLEKRDG